MRAIPSFRAAHLAPYLDFLSGLGAPVERGLRSVGLPTMFADSPDVFLPQLPSLAFLDRMSASEGIDDLALRALNGMRLTDLSEVTLSEILGSPTLKVALGHFGRLVHLEDTYVQSWLSIDGDTAKLHMTNFYPLDQQGLRYEDWAELSLLKTVVRAFAGPSWTPQVMGFRSNELISRFASETFPDTRFLTGQKSVFVTLSRGLLDMPPHKTGKQLATCPNYARPVGQHWDFATSLRQVLSAYLIDGAPTIQFAAELADTSVRTLQRRLAQADLSYSGLVRQARFELASTILQNTDRKIIDIAYELGYTDPAHFTRAFGRLAGMSPCEYRGQSKLQ